MRRLTDDARLEVLHEVPATSQRMWTRYGAGTRGGARLLAYMLHVSSSQYYLRRYGVSREACRWSFVVHIVAGTAD